MNDKLLTLTSIFITLIIVANIISSKVIVLFGIVLPAAVVVYPLTFLFTDTIGEVWGREKAQRVVIIGFWANMIALGAYWAAINLPAAPFWQSQEAFTTVLWASMRIISAGMIAYLISQTIDVQIFHRIKERMKGKHLWIRNNASTMVSQVIDTTIFITIAFYGTMPNTVLLQMIIAQYIIKIAVAGFDTVLIYPLVRWAKNDENRSSCLWKK